MEKSGKALSDIHSYTSTPTPQLISQIMINWVYFLTTSRLLDLYLSVRGAFSLVRVAGEKGGSGGRKVYDYQRGGSGDKRGEGGRRRKGGGMRSE